ncbi:MAG: hypothetical protein ACRD0P_31935, partial [Stackebrandtia sp.]
MVSFHDLWTAKPEQLTKVAGAWQKVATRFGEAKGSLDRSVTDKLHGGSLRGQSIAAASGRSSDISGFVDAGKKEATSLHST